MTAASDDREPDLPLSFAETFRAAAALGDLLGHPSICVQVSAWAGGSVTWTIWDGELNQHFYGATGWEAMTAYRHGIRSAGQPVSDAALDAVGEVSGG